MGVGTLSLVLGGEGRNTFFPEKCQAGLPPGTSVTEAGLSSFYNTVPRPTQCWRKTS